MSRVFVPLEAGVFCAFGMTVTDVRHDHVAALHVVSDAVDLDAVNERLATLESRARQELIEEGFQESDVTLERSVDARYPGQVHELTVAVPGTPRLGPADIETLQGNFHEQHLAQFAYCREDMPIECLHWRVAAVGASRVWPRGSLNGDGAHPALEPVRTREAFFAGAGGLTETAVYDVGDLRLGTRVEGPAIVVAPTTTVVLHPGDALSRETDDGFVIEVAPR
jgi:N-methylhydantoinase A